MGENGINTLLVASQVVLSIVLPFVIFPLVYLTSSSRFMSVKSPSEFTSASQTPPGVSSLHAADRGDASRDKPADPGDERIDFSSGKIVAGIGYLMSLIILAANVYVLVTL